MKNKLNTKFLTLVALIGVLICAVFASFALFSRAERASAATTDSNVASVEAAQPAPQSAQTLAAKWNAAVQESLDNGGKQVTFTLTENWTAQPDSNGFGSGVGFSDTGALLVPKGANVVLDLKTYTIDRNLADEETFLSSCIAAQSSTLEIKGTTGTITGANYSGINATGVSLIKISGGAVTENKSLHTSGGGGGLYISGGTVVMNGGEISNNSTLAYGGGVYMHQTNFTMNGGVICGNSSRYNGGGIFILGKSIFRLNDGEISENTTPQGGGGVCVWYASSGIIFEIYGGTISRNTALYGAGLIVDGSNTLIMYGGTINDNKATNSGGGVRSNAVFIMSGGKILSNTAAQAGGGISAYSNGTVTISGGSIENNTAKSGGGIQLTEGSTVKIDGGKIAQNTASDGGGICINGSAPSTVYINDGKISGNQATNCGGGIINFIGTVVMSGGEISGNTTPNDGGGIYSWKSVTMNGGKITSNTAGRGGGIYTDGGSVALNLGTISNNVVSGQSGSAGGGIFVNGCTFSLGGAVIITDNENSGTANNVHFLLGTKVTVTNSLAGSKIGVTMVTDGVFTNNFRVLNYNINPAMFFFADNGKNIVLSGNEASIGTGTAPAAPTKTLTWQYREKDGAWKTAPTASIAYTGLTYEVQAIYTSGSTTETLKIARTSYKDANGNVVSAIKNAGTYSFLVNSTDYVNPAYVLTITPIELTVTWDTSDIYYSGSVQTPAYTINGVLSADKNYVSALLNTNSAGTNAGNNYAVSIADLTGTAAVNYKFAASTPTRITYNVLKAKPTVTPNISLNNRLFAGNNLPAIAISSGDTAGTINWTDSKLVKGTKSYAWTFTPDDTKNYETLTGSCVFTAEEVALESISGSFNAGSNTVYTTTTFDQLKSYITLTGTNNDGTTLAITDYKLYGSLSEGDCVLTVVYKGISTEIEITGVQGVGGVILSSVTAKLGADSQTTYSAFDKFNPAGITVTAVYSDGTEKVVADYSFTYADITKDSFTAGDSYVNIKYTDGTDTVTCQLRGLTVSKANPTVNPDISFNKTLFEKENLPKISLSSGDTEGTISWTEATLTAGTKSYTWVFTPTDITNYSTATGSYTFTAETLALKSLTAVYTPADGFTVKTTTPLSDLKDKITVSGTFNDGTPITNIVNFELFGTLTAGESTLTVAYGGLTTTVTIPDVVLVETEIKVTGISVTVLAIGTPIYPETSLDDIKAMIEVTATYSDGTTKPVDKADYDLYATLKVGDSKLLVEYEGVTGSKIVTVQSSEGGGARVTVRWTQASYTYDGKVHLPTPYIEWDGEKIMLEAKLVDGFDGTSAGMQKVEAIEPDSGKYLLTGETVLTYAIEKAEVSVVWSSEDGWTYNGEAQNPAAQIKASFNDGKLAVQFKITAKSGSSLTDGKAVNAGNYVAEVVLDGADNYIVNGSKSFEFTIAKKRVAKPTASTSEFTYNGEEQIYLPAGFDSSLMQVTGNAQTEAGEHPVTVELIDKTNYEWADGSSQSVNFTFKIGALPVADKTGGGMSSGAIVGLIIALCAVFLIAIIALVVSIRKSKAYVDPDGFNDPVSDEDLRQ